MSPRSSSHGGARPAEFDCSARYARSARIALCKPPRSSSIGDEKHVPSLLLTRRRATRGSTDAALSLSKGLVPI